jgi:hypothetical protein
MYQVWNMAPNLCLGLILLKESAVATHDVREAFILKQGVLTA